MTDELKNEGYGSGGGSPPRKTRVGASDDNPNGSVIEYAQEEARSLGHNFVGTELVLLGLIREKRNLAGKVLRDSGISLNAARIEVKKLIGYGSGYVAEEIPFTPRAKRMMERAGEEARRLGDNYISTEHLLLGLLHDDEGAGLKVLEQLGANLAWLEKATLEMRESCRKL